MNKIISITLVFVLISCKSSQTEDSKNASVTSNDFKEVVSFLASDDLKGRNTGTVGIDEAATFIEEHLKRLDIKPYFNTYRDNFTITDNFLDEKSGLKMETVTDAFNVIGFLEGNDSTLKNEYIILSAHYDHIGASKVVANDSIANGANDNAAGTSAVLALAKYFSAKKSNKRSLIFALFSAEEKGLLGSKHLAERFKEDKVDVYTLVNFEMIGVPMTNKTFEAYLSGFELSNMGDKINEYTNSKMIGLLPKAKAFNLFKRSDNYPFHQALSIPSQTLSTFDFTNYEYYHHVDDEASLMDYDFMATLVNKLIPAIEKMTQTPKKEIYMYGE